MWGALLSFLGGPLLSSLVAAYKARLQALDSRDQKALELAEAEIRAEIAARSEATKLLIAEQGRWYTAMIRPLFAAPFIIFAFKVVVWDKVLGLGVTPGLDPNFWAVFQTIVVSYFGATAVERVSKIFRRGA
ncbi:MAG: hypothetical protein AB1586_33030 [Pseudomonadota bacterium]